MLRALYAATSGMFSQGKTMNVLSNNIANSQTAGFKEDRLVTSSFGEQIQLRLEKDSNAVQIGESVMGNDVSQVYTSYEQGPIKNTGRSLDLAISGEGFFTLQLRDGSTALTRNGEFILDDGGYLTDAQGNSVLGINGPIRVGQAGFTVNSGGDVLVDNTVIDTLRITCPADNATLVKQGDAIFIDTDPDQQPNAFGGKILQGALEDSNVNVTDTIADIIESSRAFQTCSRIVKMADQILQKSVNEIGRVNG